MARPDPTTKRPRRRGLDRYLLDGERIVTAAHQHWAKVALPVISVVAGLSVVLVLDSSLPGNLGLVADFLWWAWFVLFGWVAWKIIEWRHDWFVATDNRLLLTYGLITKQVAMMPLAKVTDMSYNRSPGGRLLGYGTFVMESAGQDQALHKVRWVADPDHTYRAICAEIFGVEDQERVLDMDLPDQRFGDGPPASTPAAYTDFASVPNGQDPADYSTGIRIRPAHSRSQRGDDDSRRSGQREPTSPDSDIHEADTGPIHL